MKRWYQSKTVWVGLGTSLVGLLAYLQGDAFIAQHPQVVAGLAMAAGLIQVVLRHVTDEPLGSDDD